MTDRELMQMALDAYNKFDYSRFPTVKALENSMEALRARLAQPEQDDGYCQVCDGNHCTAKNGCVALDNPRAQPEPEPVAWKDAPSKIYLQVCEESNCDQPFDSHIEISWCQDKINDSDISYVRADIAPPQREWQGLTDEEIMDACSAVWASHPIEVGRVVEEKLKEKNT